METIDEQQRAGRQAEAEMHDKAVLDESDVERAARHTFMQQAYLLLLPTAVTREDARVAGVPGWRREDVVDSAAREALEEAQVAWETWCNWLDVDREERDGLVIRREAEFIKTQEAKKKEG